MHKNQVQNKAVFALGAAGFRYASCDKAAYFFLHRIMPKTRQKTHFYIKEKTLPGTKTQWLA